MANDYIYKALGDKDKVLKTVTVGQDEPLPGDVNSMNSASWVVTSSTWASSSSPARDLGDYFSLYSGSTNGAKICDVVYAASGSTSGTFSGSFARWRYFSNILADKYINWGYVSGSNDAITFLYDRDNLGDGIRSDLNSVKIEFKASGSSGEVDPITYYLKSDVTVYKGSVGLEEYIDFSCSTGDTFNKKGRVYRDVGILAIDPDKLISASNAGTGASFDAATIFDNSANMKNFLSNSGYTSGTDSIQLKSIALKNETQYKENTYFCRLYNDEFNYTTNDTALKKSLSSVSENDDTAYDYLDYIQNNPFTMVTTIGLYNANHELVAVGRLSSPVKKDYGSELNISVKLRY